MNETHLKLIHYNILCTLEGSLDPWVDIIYETWCLKCRREVRDRSKTAFRSTEKTLLSAGFLELGLEDGTVTVMSEQNHEQME